MIFKQFNTAYIVEYKDIGLNVWQPQTYFFKYEHARNYIRSAKVYGKIHVQWNKNWRIAKFKRVIK